MSSAALQTAPRPGKFGKKNDDLVSCPIATHAGPFFREAKCVKVDSDDEMVNALTSSPPMRPI